MRILWKHARQVWSRAEVGIAVGTGVGEAVGWISRSVSQRVLLNAPSKLGQALPLPLPLSASKPESKSHAIEWLQPPLSRQAAVRPA